MSIFTSENRVATPGSDRTGLTFAYKSSLFRKATLTLGNPPPIGVVTGPFNPTRGVFQGCRTSLRREASGLADHLFVQFNDFPIDRNTGSIDSAARRGGNLRDRSRHPGST